MQETGICGERAGGNPKYGGQMMSSVFCNRRHVECSRMSNISQGISSVSVTWLNLYILGKIILASVYRIDFIGSGASLKADQEVRRFCIILTNSR